MRPGDVQEYLWRLLIDWPRAMGAPPVPAAVGAGAQRIAAALASAMNAATGADAIAPRRRCGAGARCAAEHVFGVPVARLAALAPTQPPSTLDRGGATLPASLLRELVATAPHARSQRHAR